MTKIEALKKTIYNLENGVYHYSWLTYDHCNCGVVARTILDGKTARECGSHKLDDEIEKKFGGMGSGFSGAYKSVIDYCSVTGIEMPLVFKALKDAGFSTDDLFGLEMLSDKNIILRSGGKYLQHSDKHDVIKYLKAWVEILEEEKLNKEPLVEECDATMFKKVDEVGSKIIHIYHKVEVPETIQDSLPETILS